MDVETSLLKYISSLYVPVVFTCTPNAACEIWGDSIKQNIELKFCKFTSEIPNAAVLGELSRFLLWVTTKYRILKCWWIDVHTKIFVLLKNAFKYYGLRVCARECMILNIVFCTADL